MAKRTSGVSVKAAQPLEAEADEELATMSIRFPRTMHERLRKLSFEQRRPMLEFIVQGIEMVLKAEKY